MLESIEFIKPKLIAEIGCNHKGQFEIALELIKLAKNSGADYVKFQKRHPLELLTEEQYNSPHPNPDNSYGITYGKHREFLEFSLEQHCELKSFAEKIGIGYSTSVWDEKSAHEIVSIYPDFIKVPSACNNHFTMLKILRDDYKGDVHVSVGMTSSKEVEEIINFFEERDQAKTRLIVYACTSGYPIDFNEVCLLEIITLKNKFKHRIKEIGFSGHHLGIAIDISAYTLGAVWIERHFTKDRTWKGTDHAASLEPQGLQKLARDLRNTYSALDYKQTEILEVEEVQRKKLKFQKENFSKCA